jgi:hypothetical protein
MRRAVLSLVLLCGCVTTSGSASRPITVFPPGPDADSQAGGNDQGQVWVLEHRLAAHNGCYAVQRPSPSGVKGGGIVRCGIGQLEWAISRDMGEGVDDFDALKSAMQWDAQHNAEVLKDDSVNCTMAGTPATCHVYVFTGKDGSSRSTIIGMSQLEGNALLAQCVANAGQAEAMKPVCAEIFAIK